MIDLDDVGSTYDDDGVVFLLVDVVTRTMFGSDHRWAKVVVLCDRDEEEPYGLVPGHTLEISYDSPIFRRAQKIASLSLSGRVNP